MNVLGLDIGGANLKVADLRGTALSWPFELWKRPGDLRSAVEQFVYDAERVSGARYDTLAVTMTAELCDCYATKREGVNAVLDAVEAAADGRRVRVWRTDARFVPPAKARETPLLTAASNWLAVAMLARRWVPTGPAVLIDVGSTTTDIIPLLAGRPVARGKTDPDRLLNGELVYTGVRRTPVCAAVRTVPWRGREVAVAAELFATTLDAHLVLGDIAPDPEDRMTADGRPATVGFARARLARVICADEEMLSAAEIRAIAAAVAEAQLADIRSALHEAISVLPSPPAVAVLCGAGEFVGRAALPPGLPFESLRARLGPELSDVAPAHAVAWLADQAGDGR